MKEHPSHSHPEDMADLLRLYNNLKNGMNKSFLEEDAFIRIIDYYQGKELIAKALEVTGVAISIYPFSSELLIKKAGLLLQMQESRQALAVIREAELLNHTDIDLFILKTDALLALDQQEKAVKLLQEALEHFEGEERIDLLFELADVYEDYEEFEKVFDCLKWILEEDPNNEEALYKICFWTDFTGRNEESIRLHQHIIDEYPYNELAWFNLAAAFQGLKLYEKSIEAYKFALAINEKFDFAWRNMGDACIRLRQYKEAIEALEKVLELSPPEPVIYEAIAHCHDRLRCYAQARFYYRKASHLNQTNSRLLYKIANTYYREGQWRACIKQLEVALKMHRLQPEYHLLMGECKMQLGQHKDALQHLSDVVRIRPRSIAGWEALIRCLYDARYLDDALEQSENAYRITQGKPLFLYYKSAVLLASRKPKDAVLFLEKALDKQPRLLKKFIALNPSVLQNQLIVDVLARYKRRRTI
jgi:tetratricopeptide (TPR) repeat protein